MTGPDFEKRSKERSTEEASNRPIPILQGEHIGVRAKLRKEVARGVWSIIMTHQLQALIQ